MHKNAIFSGDDSSKHTNKGRETERQKREERKREWKRILLNENLNMTSKNGSYLEINGDRQVSDSKIKPKDRKIGKMEK